MAVKTQKLTDILLSESLVSAAQLDEARAERKLTGAPIQKILVEKGLISPEALAQAVGRQLNIPFVRLTGLKIDPQIIKTLPEDIARRRKAIPVRFDEEGLHVAFASPLDLPARDEIKMITGCRIFPMVAPEKEIAQAINQYYRVEETSKQILIDMRMKKLKDGEQDKIVSIDDGAGMVQNLPVVKLVNDILVGAINAKASDLHLEPQEPDMVVRFRVDGILHDIMTVPRNIESSVVSRIKILANLDISERRVPQDGHISMQHENKDYDFRVSTLLTAAGEKVVLRVLDREKMMIDLEGLGFAPHDLSLFSSLISKPYGMLLVTGPTGSGKSTTLYAALNQMDGKRKNIVTIEDPVEYRMNRINQVQVHAASKLTFSTGLRTIVRQDPDIIMIGEIRDRETAEISVQAALTGHLLLSTLHTNDAPSAVTRLVDMGVEPFLIASTVIGAMAQRLCRKICPECREDYEPAGEEAQKIGLALEPGQTLARGRGCDFCLNTGYKGRTGIYEMMKMSDGIRDRILEGASDKKIKELAVKEGMQTLQENALLKVVEKVSTIEEVSRVVYTE